MGKNKLARWAEIKTFGNVIEPDNSTARDNPHPLRGLWKSSFSRNDNPLVLELGCGKGEYTTGLARLMPGKNFIGIDIKGARLWRGAKTAFENNLTNVLFIRTRIEFITSFFAENEIDEIWIPFPDPHPKGRSATRRLTSPVFLNMYRTFLRDNGVIHLKTDNEMLYRYTENIALSNKLDIIASLTDIHSSENPDEILSLKTFYEAGFIKEGRPIYYLSFRLSRDKEIIYEHRQ